MASKDLHLAQILARETNTAMPVLDFLIAEGPARSERQQSHALILHACLLHRGGCRWHFHRRGFVGWNAGMAGQGAVQHYCVR